jgi:protein phosphatase
VDELVTIGAFARLTQLSPKALRLYDDLGLLRPAAVDGDSGYRYYRPAQAERARLIAWLRRLGLPLAQIGEVLALSPEAAAAVVQEHRARLAVQTAERDRLAGFLIDYLTKGSVMTIGLRCAGRTEMGLVRPTNEDSVYAGTRLVAVADGVSGPAGQAASAAATEALQSWNPSGDLLAALSSIVGTVVQAVQEVKAEGEAVTTVTALLWAGEDRLALVHIGDTRAYVLRSGELVQLTHDHTYVQSLVDSGTLTPEEAAVHPQRALLVRALTGRGDDRPDVSTRDARPGERYLLASDGLTSVVPGARLRDLLAQAAGPDEAVAALIDAAHQAGAPDNIACAVADVVAR